MSIVTYRPLGRLGNQIFQLACAIGYAKKHGMQWSAPSNTYEVPEFHQFFPGLPQRGMVGQRYNAHDPSTFAYKEIPHFPDGVTLVGFFQSLKYFDNAQEEVKQALKIKYVDGYEDYISIHVRRGDYVTNPESFPPVTLDYIQEALRYVPFSSEGDFKKVMVFSDDIQWCKDNLPSLPGKYVMSFSEGRNQYEDLCLMASCSHHIIANSSFSWWAGYLGRNTNKIVVSPHHTSWFGPRNTNPADKANFHDTKDLIPDSWHQIKFR